MDLPEIRKAAALLQEAYNAAQKAKDARQQLELLFPDETERRKLYGRQLLVAADEARKAIKAMRPHLKRAEDELYEKWAEGQRAWRGEGEFRMPPREEEAGMVEYEPDPRTPFELWNLIERLPDGYRFPVRAKLQRGTESDTGVVSVQRSGQGNVVLRVNGIPYHSPTAYLLVDYTGKVIKPRDGILLDGGTNLSWGNIQEVLRSADPASADKSQFVKAGDRYMQRIVDRVGKTSRGIYRDDTFSDVWAILQRVPPQADDPTAVVLKDMLKVAKNRDIPMQRKAEIFDENIRRWQDKKHAQGIQTTSLPIMPKRAPAPRPAPVDAGLGSIEQDLAAIESEIDGLGASNVVPITRAKKAPPATGKWNATDEGFTENYKAFVANPRNRKEFVRFFLYNDANGEYSLEGEYGLAYADDSEILEEWAQVFGETMEEEGLALPRVAGVKKIRPSERSAAIRQTARRQDKGEELFEYLKDFAKMYEGFRARMGTKTSLWVDTGPNTHKLGVQLTGVDGARIWRARPDGKPETIWQSEQVGGAKAVANLFQTKINEQLDFIYGDEPEVKVPAGVKVDERGVWEWRDQDKPPPVFVGLPVTIHVGSHRSAGVITDVNKTRTRITIKDKSGDDSGRYSYRKGRGYFKVGTKPSWHNSVDLGRAVDSFSLD